MDGAGGVRYFQTGGNRRAVRGPDICLDFNLFILVKYK